MRPVRCRLSRVIFGRSTKRPASGSESRRGARQGQQERSTTLNARIDRSTAVAAAPRTQLRSLAGAVLTIFVAAFVLTPAGTLASAGAPDVSVIVRTLSGAQARIEGFVTSEGGSITAELPIIDGFSATLSQRVADAIGADSVGGLDLPRRRARAAGVVVRPRHRHEFHGLDHEVFGSDGLVARRIHRGWRRRRADRYGRRPGHRSGRDQQGDLRAGPLYRVAVLGPDEPGYVRARNVHGWADRRERSDLDGAVRPVPSERVSRDGSRRPDRQPEGRNRGRRDRRLPGDRRYRLGRPACERPRHEHPRAEPVLRHQQRAAVHGGSRSRTPPRWPGSRASWSSRPAGTTGSRAT